MAKKKYDLAVKVGEFTNQQGETKARWKNVGALISGDNGPYLLLDKTFNPAGLAEPGRESIIISCFEPKDEGRQQQAAQPSAPADLDSDLPF